MPRARWRAAGVLAVATAALGAPACATPDITPAIPVRSGSPTVSVDDREESQLLVEADVYRDADLSDYLVTVVDHLLSQEERSTDAPSLTITVVRDPTQNAFALPTGRIFIHTGLLARLDNEAQLATILGRELGHLSRRRTLTRSASDAPLQSALGAIAPTIGRAIGEGREPASGLLSPIARIILGKRLAIAYAAAVDGYGPAAAREADADAVVRVARAGYEPSEAPRAFERLRRHALAGGMAERFFYGNAAALAARVEVTAPLVTTSAAVADPVITTAAFAERITSARRENTRLELGLGRFRLAQAQLDRILAADPSDATAHVIQGDLYRLRAQRARGLADRDELVRQAVASYARCLELDPGIADVHRQLGLLYYQLRRLDDARAAFARYVTLAPDAADVERVREYLAER